MLLKRYSYKYRPYVAASLILFAVSILAITVGQSESPPNSTSQDRSPLSPAGISGIFSGAAVRSQGQTAGTGLVGPIVRRAVKSDTSPPLRSIKPVLTKNKAQREQDKENARLPGRVTKGFVMDRVVQNWLGPLAMPTPVVNFEGMANPNIVWPPDTNGDVGPNHYVQMVNSSFQIWDKNGTSLYGPTEIRVLWRGFGGLCDTADNRSDPIVLYDSLADRWLLTQLVYPADVSQSYECFAISTTPDPTGTYHRFDFLSCPSFLADYPHFGVWPDGYYMTTNEFACPGGVCNRFLGAGNFAFERAKMLTGDGSAQMIYFDLNTQGDSGMLPSDLDGPPPPANSPDYFMEAYNDTAGVLREFKFHTDWVNPANATFTGPITITVAPWTFYLCSQNQTPTPNCIDQPGAPSSLSALNDRLMPRLTYRNLGDHESLIVNHTTNADGHGLAGVRWYEIRNPDGTPFAYQQGTYSPSPDHRWMGSISMDHAGNMALGYSVSNATNIYPSIRYTGRLASDPPGTMSQGEGSLIVGGGSQIGLLCSIYGSCDRWGDYTGMSVDPVDDCTFWYTNEYYQTTSDKVLWQTRIGSFKFPSCLSGPTNTPTNTATPTLTVTGTPPTFTPTFTPSNTPTITPTACGNYTITQSFGATIVPGTTLVAGSQGDNVIANIPLPFTYNFYGQSFDSVNASSNGNLQFTSSNSSDYTNTCLPAPALNNAILAHWQDLCTGNCFIYSCDVGCGVFTSVSGSAPARIFNIEWHACLPNGIFGCDEVHFEVRLYEGQNRFDIVYGTVNGSGSGATVGVQRGTGTGGGFTQFECNQGNLQPGLLLTFIAPVCVIDTPTITQTPTITPTRTTTLTHTRTPVTSYLVGHVTWQGPPPQPNPLQQLPITLTLKLGATEVNYPTTTTDVNGHFVESVTGLSDGTYNWRVKGPKYLANAGTVALTGAPNTSAEMGLMKPGDCNDDNRVNVADFIILKNTFGRQSGDPGYDDRADFTGDQHVNAVDFVLLKGTFGFEGAPPILPRAFRTLEQSARK